MPTVADFAQEFVQRAQRGESATVFVAKKHAEPFLVLLQREGFSFSKACIEQISDPELRRVVEALFYSTVAGAMAGASVGAMVAGPAGAKVGALVGAGAGLVAGSVAVMVTLRERDGGLVLSVR